MGCTSSSSIIASDISEMIHIHQFFSGLIKPKWELNRFSEYSVFRNYKVNNLTLENYIQSVCKTKLTIFLKAHISVLNRLKKMTKKESVHLSNALSLSIAQTILNMYQNYLEYRDNFITEKYYDKNISLIWGNTIKTYETSGKRNYINPDTNDSTLIKNLEKRMAEDIIAKINNYNMDYHFETIFLRMIEHISETVRRI
jgi:hypothetical protein